MRDDKAMVLACISPAFVMIVQIPYIGLLGGVEGGFAQAHQLSKLRHHAYHLHSLLFE
jgi:hypothetical protein